MTACAACLRLSFLVGELAPAIAGVLDRPGRRSAGVLALGEEELMASVAGRRAGAAREFLASFDPDRARERIDGRGLAAVCRHADLYPEGLRSLTDPPAVLYLAGRGERALEALGPGPAATVVGARRASPYGLEVARELGRTLAVAGVPVVSGLALGIDAASHRGALAGGGLPVAVLAGGADVPYPRAHARLYERVREAGAVISELPPGARPLRWSFPARNRIMAALAGLTVVVEAADPSGSLITAAFAMDLGREVGAVPGRVTAAGAAGTNRLLREGASVIRGAEDVLDALFGAGARPAPPAPPADVAASLPPEIRRILEAVEAGRPMDELGEAAGLPPGAVRAALGRLELLGLVARDPLGGYERRAAM